MKMEKDNGGGTGEKEKKTNRVRQVNQEQDS